MVRSTCSILWSVVDVAMCSSVLLGTVLPVDVGLGWNENSEFHPWGSETGRAFQCDKA